MFTPPIIHRRPRNRPDPSKVFRGGTFAAAKSIVATKFRLTFTESVSLNGIPAFTVQGVLPTAAAAVTDKIIDLDYLANVVGGNAWHIPAGDKSIRNSVGGTVAAGDGVF